MELFFKEITFVHCEIHTEAISTLCGRVLTQVAIYLLSCLALIVVLSILMGVIPVIPFLYIFSYQYFIFYTHFIYLTYDIFIRLT
jgi:hypothetical protein